MTDYGSRITVIGIFVSVIGAMLVIVGFFLSSLQPSNGGSTSFGGVILIGPFPIVFGTDKTTLLIAVVGTITLVVLSFAAMFVNSRRIRHLMDEPKA